MISNLTRWWCADLKRKLCALITSTWINYDWRATPKINASHFARHVDDDLWTVNTVKNALCINLLLHNEVNMNIHYTPKIHTMFIKHAFKKLCWGGLINMLFYYNLQMIHVIERYLSEHFLKPFKKNVEEWCSLLPILMERFHLAVNCIICILIYDLSGLWCDSRTATKFCTHIRVDMGLIRNKNNLTLPTPGGFPGGFRGSTNQKSGKCHELSRKSTTTNVTATPPWGWGF